ncbi:PHB depolymerase family esterase [Longispora sp. K20-0274]|uniref:extracellular catalytic domain type 1 short-chain-length polyhydroxyalkanoate depolymerase n=1 Tax=Longispora sp. K20-0274 TaxID=3088255 RepID=UPI00399BD30D
MRPLRFLTVLALCALALAPAAPAHAAALTEVTGFGSNPGELRMFTYVPPGLPAHRPLVVALHGCGQNAAGYATDSGWTELADRYALAVLAPQTSTANNIRGCFNWFEPGDTARDAGEALSIRQMVGRLAADTGADPGRVYVTGLSAGGAMTAVMLATYPDVFAGGGIAAGLPYRCATTVLEATVNCMSQGVDLTPARWGDKVRAASGWTGPWPVVSLWQGTADPTVNPVNLRELADQWTDAHGADRTADVTDTVRGYPHQVFRDPSGTPVVETFSVTGMKHAQPIDPGAGPDRCGRAGDPYILDVDVCAAYQMMVFWGLAAPTPDPTPTPGPTPTPTPTCFTASNYAHTQAGRAHVSAGYTYANGSDQPMGLWNAYVTSSLRQTAPGYFVVGC